MSNGGCKIASNFSDLSYVAHTNTSFTTSGLGHFTDDEGDTISITEFTITPSQTFLTVNSAYDTFTIDDPGNADVGNYTVSIYCVDPYSDTGVANMSFTIEITENIGCKISSSRLDESYPAHINTTVAFTFADHFSDPDGEDILFTGYDISPSNDFLTLNTTDLSVDVANPNNTGALGNYTISIY